MQRKNNIILIKTIAIITAGTALYVLFPRYWMHWYLEIKYIASGYSPYEGLPWWVLPTVILFDLVLICKLIAAYGIFKLKNWGRIIAIPSLSVDFLIRLCGFINFRIYKWQHPEPPKIPEGTVHVAYISPIPSYIIGIISVLLLIFLVRKSTKQLFIKVKNTTA